MRNALCTLGVWVLSGGLVAGGCESAGGGAGDAGGTGDAPAPADLGDVGRGADFGDIAAGGSGHIVYALPDGRLFRLAAEAGAAPEDLGAALEALSPGADEAVNIAPDGAWLIVSTERFGCGGWACLAVARGDLSAGAAVLTAAGENVHAEGAGAIASGGARIAYATSAGAGLGLYVLDRSGTGWGSPQLVTGDSPFAYNEAPAFSADGARLVFHCGAAPYGQEGSALCEVGADGSGFRVVLRPEDGPGGSATNALRAPDYAPDGSIVFEADWGGEQIWQLPAAGGAPRLIGATFGNDNTPCVLPDGRIASLWLGRADGAGLHEIKVMHPDGTLDFMALVDVDVLDAGLGCGE